MRVLYFSTVNWKWIKQRPHFLAEYLSHKSIEVDYFSLTPFKKQKIKRLKVGHQLKVKDTYVIPLASKFKIIEKLNICYVKGLLSQTHYDKIILTHPMQYEYLTQKQRNTAEIIYECMDNMPYFYTGSWQKRVIQEEAQLCQSVKKIIVSSNYLKQRLIKEYKIQADKITVILNAVDKKEFNLAVQPVELKKPNLVYIGSISEWLDMDTLKKFASCNKDYYIYLIGPIDHSIRKEIDKSMGNIIWVDSIPHSQVKDYIAASDIMLIPFKINELIRGVDPVKMYEYLSMGAKVLSSYWQELEQYKDNELVDFYNDYDEFEQKVYAFTNQDKNLIKNDCFIENNSWEVRVEEYLHVLIR